MRFANSSTGLAETCYIPVSPMRILVVEDDDKIASFVVNGLKQSGFAVDRAKDGEQALDFGLSISYDAAVLDLMLPGLDGLSVLRQLRQKKVSLPVLILSARAGVEDRVLGLQSGGDDYLTKPFAFSELLARVQALIRRATHSPEPSHLSVADLKMDLFTREVVRAGQKIELQSREFALLELLLRHLDLLPLSYVGARRGMTVLTIRVLADGKINSMRISQSSGYSDIDERVEKMVIAVGRLPPLPQWIQGQWMDFTFQLHFPHPLQR